MSRIIRTGNTPAKQRNAHMRSCAEVLRLLALRPALASGTFDDEARDMVAFLVFSLFGIEKTIETSARAWDDRNYWKKAEKLRADWRWAPQTADRIRELMITERWKDIPPLLIELIPRFQAITVAQHMRDADWWVGAYRALLREADNPVDAR
ncbi:MAG: hypothetical protein R3284_09055 [Rubricoccaceae bacterium]|nr:hypothetical protein [Rubricoccaceae bacterium]